MIGRILGLLFGFVAAVFLVTLAVANRHTVQLVLDPFNPLDPILAVELPSTLTFSRCSSSESY